MTDRNERSDYLSLADAHTKGRIARIAIIVTILLTLYNAVQSADYRRVIADHDAIVELSKTSEGVPLTYDWFVDGMFKEHGVYDRDSLKALINAAYEHPIDTAAANVARKKQRVLLNRMRTTMEKAFSLKLPFVSDQPLNFQYWIFILPFVYILSAIYQYIVRRKMVILNDRMARNNEMLEDFDRYPSRFLSKILLLIEVASLCMLFYVYATIVRGLPGYSKYMVFLFVIGAYYGAVYALGISSKLDRDLFGRSGMSRVWKALCTFLQKTIRGFPFTRSSAIGSLLVLSTLFIVFSFKSCEDDRSMPVADEYAFFRNGRWHEVGKVILDEDDVIKGYEYIVNFRKKNWNYGKEGSTMNRIYQAGYVLAVLTAVVFLAARVGSRFRKKGVARRPLLFRWLFFIATNLFLLFSVYYGTTSFAIEDTIPLIFRTGLAGFVLYAWWYVNRKDLRPTPHKAKVIVLLSLPFIAMLIANYLEIAIVLAGDIGIPFFFADLLYRFYFPLANEFVLPLGLLFLMVAAYKKLNDPEHTTG